MALLYFFICSWVLITILLFILTRHPEENEKWSTFILEIITLSTLLTIAEVVIVLVILGVLALFGVIG
jgi:hypothetical protein